MYSVFRHFLYKNHEFLQLKIKKDQLRWPFGYLEESSTAGLPSFGTSRIRLPTGSNPSPI